jgi:hypothetical protein
MSFSGTTHYLPLKPISGTPPVSHSWPTEVIAKMLAELGLLEIEIRDDQPIATTKLWLKPHPNRSSSPGELRAHNGTSWVAVTPTLFARHIVSRVATSELFTAADRVKLDGIEAGATADMTGTEIAAALDVLLGPGWRATGISYALATQGAHGLMSATDKTKLDGIPAGTHTPTAVEITNLLDTYFGSFVWRQGTITGAGVTDYRAGIAPEFSGLSQGAALSTAQKTALGVAVGDTWVARSVSPLIKGSANGSNQDVWFCLAQRIA